MKTFLIAFCLLILHCFVGPKAVQSQANDIGSQVISALNKAKDHNDLGDVYTLCKEKGAAVLPYFQKYMTDPNLNVRLGVETAAAHFSTKVAAEMLTQLVADKEIGLSNNAEEDIDRLFTRQQITKLGGKALQHNLLARVKNGSASGLSLLMLGYFPPDANTVKALNALRAQDTDQKVELPVWLPPFRRVMIDVTLAELGDKSAALRVKKIIRQGTVAEVYSFLGTIRYIVKPAILLDAVELLKDKRETEAVRGGQGLSAPGSPVPVVTYLRVCDIALRELAGVAKTDIGVDPAIVHQRPLTDAELSVAYMKLSAYFKGRK